MITSRSARITLYFAKTGRETDNDDEEFRSLCQSIGSYIKKMPRLGFNAYKLSKTVEIILYYNHTLSKLSTPILKVKVPTERL